MTGSDASDVYFAWIRYERYEEIYLHLLISFLILNTLIQNQLQMNDNYATK